jgi:AraC-like DNA-binding protein
MPRGRPSSHGVAVFGEGQPPLLLVCVENRSVLCGLRDAVKGRAEVLVADTFSDLRQLSRQHASRVEAVIVGTRDRTGAIAAAVVRDLIEADLDVPIIASCLPGAKNSATIRELAVAGVHEILFEGIDDVAIAVRHVIDAAGHECAAHAVMRRLGAYVPRRLHTFVEYCLDQGTGAKSATEIARLIGMNRKTVFDHCRAAGLPGPKELRMWCRLLLAAYLLERPSRSVDSVANELEFSSSSAFRNLTKHHFGITPSELRTLGGLAYAVDAFATRIGTQHSPAKERPAMRA